LFLLLLAFSDYLFYQISRAVRQFEWPKMRLKLIEFLVFVAKLAISQAFVFYQAIRFDFPIFQSDLPLLPVASCFCLLLCHMFGGIIQD